MASGVMTSRGSPGGGEPECRVGQGVGSGVRRLEGHLDPHLNSCVASGRYPSLSESLIIVIWDYSPGVVGRVQVKHGG